MTRRLHRAAHISPPINTFDSLQDNNRLSAAASRSNTLLECAPGGAGSRAGGGGEQQAGGRVTGTWQVGGGDGKGPGKLGGGEEAAAHSHLFLCPDAGRASRAWKPTGTHQDPCADSRLASGAGAGLWPRGGPSFSAHSKLSGLPSLISRLFRLRRNRQTGFERHFRWNPATAERLHPSSQKPSRGTAQTRQLGKRAPVCSWRGFGGNAPPQPTAFPDAPLDSAAFGPHLGVAARPSVQSCFRPRILSITVDPQTCGSAQVRGLRRQGCF